MAVATLITLRDEKKKSAAKGALEVFGPSIRGMRGSAGRYACRTPGGHAGSSVAVSGSRSMGSSLRTWRRARSVARSGVDRAGRPHYLNRAWALSATPRAAPDARSSDTKILAPGPLGDSLTVEPRTLTPLV